jgi:hypothetical protein
MKWCPTVLALLEICAVFLESVRGGLVVRVTVTEIDGT